jgi:UDP-N-acetyl-D-glucosamine dehydrogenase
VDNPRESPALKIRAPLSYNDPFIPTIPHMRHHRIRPESESLTVRFLVAQDCVVIFTDHAAYNDEWIVNHAPLVVDTRNATTGVALGSGRIVKS